MHPYTRNRTRACRIRAAEQDILCGILLIFLQNLYIFRSECSIGNPNHPKPTTVENDKQGRRNDKTDSVFSRKIRAGRRRTYFFDVRTTRGNDYYLTITESKKRYDGNGYERHKIFLYKEDFNKFLEEATAVIDHVKQLMPDFDFDSFSHKYDLLQEDHQDHEDHEDHEDLRPGSFQEDHMASADAMEAMADTREEEAELESGIASGDEDEDNFTATRDDDEDLKM